jgi:ribonuclease HI
VVIKGDSELVVKQLTKEYKCISENLLSYFVSASSLLINFESISLQHVPRIENQVEMTWHKLLQDIKFLHINCKN